jgi:hypothetical protein
MRVPKAKSRVVKSHNLRSLDGVKDVAVGSADVDARRGGNFKKKGGETAEPDFDDDKARRDRYGFPF